MSGPAISRQSSATMKTSKLTITINLRLGLISILMQSQQNATQLSGAITQHMVCLEPNNDVSEMCHVHMVCTIS